VVGTRTESANPAMRMVPSTSRIESTRCDRCTIALGAQLP
jgi:hypothetical protein